MCVYRIWDTESGQSYIGSTKDFRKRIAGHRYKLKYGRHHAPRLQGAWEKRKDKFVFQILEMVNYSEELCLREQWWMELFQSYIPKIGYNESHYAGMPYGPRLPLHVKQRISRQSAKRKASPETRRRMSESMLGKKNTKRHNLNISRAQAFFAGLKGIELLILRACGTRTMEIAKHFGCDRHTVSRALGGGQLACRQMSDPVLKENRHTGQREAALTTRQRREVVMYAEQGVKQLHIAKWFGVSRGVIENVRHGTVDAGIDVSHLPRRASPGSLQHQDRVL